MTIENHDCPICGYPVIVDTVKGTTSHLECTHEVGIGYFMPSKPKILMKKAVGAFSANFDEGPADPEEEFFDTNYGEEVPYPGHNDTIQVGHPTTQTVGVGQTWNHSTAAHPVPPPTPHHHNNTIGAGITIDEANAMVEEETANMSSVTAEQVQEMNQILDEANVGGTI